MPSVFAHYRSVNYQPDFEIRYAVATTSHWNFQIDLITLLNSLKDLFQPPAFLKVLNGNNRF